MTIRMIMVMITAMVITITITTTITTIMTTTMTTARHIVTQRRAIGTETMRHWPAHHG
jgi:hypothetical protein